MGSAPSELPKLLSTWVCAAKFMMVSMPWGGGGAPVAGGGGWGCACERSGMGAGLRGNQKRDEVHGCDVSTHEMVVWVANQRLQVPQVGTVLKPVKHHQLHAGQRHLSTLGCFSMDTRFLSPHLVLGMLPGKLEHHV